MLLVWIIIVLAVNMRLKNTNKGFCGEFPNKCYLTQQSCVCSLNTSVVFVFLVPLILVTDAIKWRTGGQMCQTETLNLKCQNVANSFQRWICRPHVSRFVNVEIYTVKHLVRLTTILVCVLKTCLMFFKVNVFCFIS